MRVAPSILSADFARLREQVGEVLDAGARMIHVDVMDGHFVPPITVGPLVVAALREQVSEAGAMLDVHLMIERPERHVADFVQAGADSITFHAEATPHVAYTGGSDSRGRGGRRRGDQPGHAGRRAGGGGGALDMALCMTVNPGWGGQPFIAHSPQKIERVRAIVGAGVAVEVDGGIDPADRAGTAARRARACSWRARRSSARADPGEAYLAIARSVEAG